MQNFTFIRYRPNLPPKLPQSQAGYTLLELLVVLGIVGVVSAIAAPGWLGFVQQRRVNSANDSVLRALQEAQSKAKTQKLSYSVSLRIQNRVPQVAVYPGSPTSIDKYWKPLGDQVSFKPGQIWLGTNATSSNIAGTSLDNPNLINPDGVKAVTFDNSGALPTTPTPKLDPQGLIIAVGAAQPRSSPPAPILSTRRCVKISTLLGSIQTGKVDNTDACKPI